MIGNRISLSLPVLLLGLFSFRVEAGEQETKDIVSALRSADHDILLAGRAAAKGEKKQAVQQYRKSCISVLGVLEVLGAQAFVQLQHLQGRGGGRAMASLKMLDTLSLYAERLLTQSLDEVAALAAPAEVRLELSSLHKQFPRNRAIHERLLGDYAKMGRWDDVLDESVQLLRNHPSSKSAHLLQAKANEALGRKASAILACQRALEIDDSDSTTYVTLYRLLVAEGRANEWEVYLRRKSRLNAHNPVIRSLLQKTAVGKVDSDRSVK